MKRFICLLLSILITTSLFMMALPVSALEEGQPFSLISDDLLDVGSSTIGTGEDDAARLEDDIKKVELMNNGIKIPFNSASRETSPNSNSLDGVFGNLITFKPVQTGEWIEFTTSIIPAGEYTLKTISKYYNTYGKYQISIDDSLAGEVVDFSNNVGGEFKTQSFDTIFEFATDGIHKIRYTLIDGGGKDGYNLAVESAEFNAKDDDSSLTPIDKMDDMYFCNYTDISLGSLKYRLYVPTDYSEDTSYPLFVYLNGAGSRGDDNTKQLNNLGPIISPLINNKAYSAIIAIPQIPTSKQWVNTPFAGGSYIQDDLEESDSLRLLIGMIDDLSIDYSIDDNRLYLMGQSMGGYGTWDAITRYPDKFAAAIPMCGGADPSKADKITHIPIFTLHGDADTSVPVSGTREMVSALEAEEGNITYLEFPGMDHYIQRRLFEQPDLWISWLFDQAKDKTPTTPDISTMFNYDQALSFDFNSTIPASWTFDATATSSNWNVSGNQLSFSTSGDTEGVALYDAPVSMSRTKISGFYTFPTNMSNDGGGPVFDYQDNNNYSHVRITKDSVQLLKKTDGTMVTLKTESLDYVRNRIACLSVTIEGRDVIVTLDGVKVLEYTYSTDPNAVGQVGIRYFAGSATVDDFTVSFGAPFNPENASLLPYYNDYAVAKDEFTPQWNITGGSLKGYSGANTGTVSLLDNLTLPANYTINSEVSMTNISMGSTGTSGGVVFSADSSSSFFHYRIDRTSSGVQSVQLYRWNNGSASKIAEQKVDWNTDEKYILTVTVEGSKIKCYLDDQLMIEHTTSLNIGGSAGFRVYSAEMDIHQLKIEEGIFPPTNESPLYTENFDDAATDFPIDDVNWKIVNRFGGKALQGVAATGGSSLIRLPNLELPQDYSIGVDVTLVGDSGINAGLTFAHLEAQSTFTHLRVGVEAKKAIQLYQWNNGTATKLREQERTIGSGTASVHRLWITNENGVISCYIDGELAFAEDITRTGGSIGFRVYGGTALFDNLVVWEGIKPAELPPTIPTDEIIWDINDVFYSEEGSWSDASATNINYDGGEVRMSGYAGDFASWSEYLDYTGKYEVYYWRPIADDIGETTFSFSSVDGNWRKVIDLRGETSGWTKLSTIKGQAGTALTVTQTNTDASANSYASAIKLVKTNNPADEQFTPGGTSDEIAVLVNQLGYDTGRSKRATIPNAVDGTAFTVINASTHQTVFNGQVENNIADFSSVNPTSKTDYYIKCEEAESFVFTISKNWIQQVTVVPALDFMEQSRQDEWLVGGNTGYGWRDSHQFSFELNSLVYQYMANPGYYNRMTDPVYKMELTEYPELRTKAPDEPSIVWLMKFAATRYYDWGANKNIKSHMLIKEQLAYFLYIYPEIKQWVDEDFYIKVRDYTIKAWSDPECNKQWYPVANTSHDLFAIQNIFGGLKGAQPPGHSITPNLMMYDVLKRDNIDGAENFFSAAYDNTKWIIDNLDISDPRYNKGQRMSEHVLIENLTYFLEMHPAQAPVGLEQIIKEWADATILRSDNMWDTRMAASLSAGDSKYQLSNGTPISKDYWTGAAYAADDEQLPIIRNEPGNVAGIQAITFAASRVIDDNQTSERLKEIGVSAIDDMFGRNPSSRAYFYSVRNDFEGGDLGWYTVYVGGYGALGSVEGRIDANPAEGAYPYNPAGAQGYTEGWVAYNAAWNMSLAYSAAEDIAIDVAATANAGDNLSITLKAPLNMDYRKIEIGQIWIEDLQTGEKKAITVTEDSADSNYFNADFTVPNSYAVRISYGFGLFKKSIDVGISGGTSISAESVIISPQNAELGAGERIYLTATVVPDITTDKRISWSTSDESIATVDNRGQIKAIKSGVVTITATASGGASDSIIIIVTNAKLAKIKLTASPSSIRPNERTIISVVGIMQDGKVGDISNATIKYAPIDNTLSTVNSFGVVTAASIAETAAFKVTLSINDITVDATISIAISYESEKIRYQFEQLNYTASHAGTTDTVTDNDADLKKVMTVKPNQTQVTDGAYVDFQIPTLSQGHYNVLFNSKRYSAYGIMQFSVDGVNLGYPVDGYQTSITYQQVTLGELVVDHDNPLILRMAVIGKNASSTGYNSAIDYIEFIKVGEINPISPPDLTLLETQINTSTDLYEKSKSNIHPSDDLLIFKDAIDDAINILCNLTSTSDEIDVAIRELDNQTEIYTEALTAYVKELLEYLVVQFESEDKTRYDVSSWNVYKDAYSDAKLTLSQSLLNWEALAMAVNSLQTAFNELVPLVPITKYNINVNYNDGGTASANFFKAQQGELVTISAKALEGYTFKEWVIVSGGVILQNNLSAVTTLIVGTENIQLKAVFEKETSDEIKYTVTISTTVGGRSVADKVSAIAGDVVNLVAMPEIGYSFVEWQVNRGQVEVTDKIAPKTTFIMPNEAIEITGIFKVNGKDISSTINFVQPGKDSVAASGNKLDGSPADNFQASLSQAELSQLMQKSKANGSSVVRSRSYYNYSVSGDILSLMQDFDYQHDTVKEQFVSVRIYIDNPSNLSKNLKLYATVASEKINKIKLIFNRYFTNEIEIISFDQQEDWEKPVGVAAKIDTGKMNVKDLAFYQYCPSQAKL